MGEAVSDWEEVSEWEDVPDSPPPDSVYPTPPTALDPNYEDQGPPSSAAGSEFETKLRRAGDRLALLGEGAAQGWMPQIAGAAGAVMGKLADTAAPYVGREPFDANKSILERYREARDSARNYYRQAERDNPEEAGIVKTGGNIAGGIGLAGTFFPKASGAVGGAILGGINGLGNSKADLTKGEFSEAIGPTVGGATIGAISGKAFDVAGTGASAIAEGIGGSAKQALGRILQKPEKLINKFKSVASPATPAAEQATRAMESQAAEATARTPLEFKGGNADTGAVIQKQLGELAKVGDPSKSYRAALAYGDDAVKAAAERNAAYKAELEAARVAKERAMNTAQWNAYKKSIRSQEPLPVDERLRNEIKMEWPSANPVARKRVMDEVNTVGPDAIKKAPSSLDDLYAFERAKQAANAPQPGVPQTPDIGDYTNRSTIFNRLSKEKQAAIKMDNAGSDPMFWQRSDEALTGAPRAKDLPIDDKWTADFPEPTFLGSEHKPMGQDSGQFLLDQIMNPQHDKTALLASEELQRKLWLQKLQNQRGFIDPGAIADAMGVYGAYRGIKGAIKNAPRMGEIGRNLEAAGKEELRANAIKAAQNPARLRYWANQEGPLGEAARWALSGDAKGLAARTFVLTMQPQFQELFLAPESASSPPTQ